MRLKTFGYLMVFCLLFTVSGCNSGGTVYIGSVYTNTDTYWSNVYRQFSGQDSKTMTVREGNPVEISVSITTDSGKLNLTIVGKDGTSYYEGNDLKTGNFTVTIDKPGDYDITLTANKHKGAFKFAWG